MNSKQLTLVALGALALVSGSTLSASDLKFGGKLNVAANTGDLRDLNKTGASAGLFALVDLGGGRAIRPQLDYYQTKRQDRGTLVASTETFTLSTDQVVSGWSLGADYVYHLSGDIEKGWYLLGGLGLASNQFKVSLDAASGSDYLNATYNNRATKPFAQVGVGYQFNENFGLEACYRHSTLGGRDGNIRLQGRINGVAGSSTSVAPMDTTNMGYFSLGFTARF